MNPRQNRQKARGDLTGDPRSELMSTKSAVECMPSPEEIAVVGPKNQTGVGRMANDLLRLFPEMGRIVTDSYRLEGETPGGWEMSIGGDVADEEIKEVLGDFRLIIVLDNVAITNRIVEAAKRSGRRIAMVALWEWFEKENPVTRLYDVVICPNRHCHRVLRALGCRETRLVGWPVNLCALPQRQIQGPCRTFVHNAGIFERDDRKGTLLTLEAFHRARAPAARLVIHAQRPVPRIVEDPRIEYREWSVQEHAELYREGEVAIQPSRAEGIGFSILEAAGSGMAVITTDAPPMNECVRDRHVLVAAEFRRRRAPQATYVRQAFYRTPRLGSLTRRIEWCASNDIGAICRRNRQWAEAVYDRRALRASWAEVLGTVG